MDQLLARDIIRKDRDIQLRHRVDGINLTAPCTVPPS